MALGVSMCNEDGEWSEENEETDHLRNNLLKCLPRTWHAQEPRRHWELILHCELAAFPKAVPNLLLPSKAARFYWHLYMTALSHERFYQKELNHALFVTLGKIMKKPQFSKNIIISDELVRLKTMDVVSRAKVIERFEDIIRKHTTLESVCLEGLSLTRKEGLRLVLALYNSHKAMKYLYCWRMFKRKEGPLLVDMGNFSGSGLYIDRTPRICDWYHAIASLESLTTLSVNYAYIATPTGDLLISLAKVLCSKWQWLQLLCLEDEVPNEADPYDGIGGFAIPDMGWLEARLWAPALKVQYVFMGIPEYDRHKRFFTRNTPMHTFVLSSDIDLRFRKPSLLDCTLKTLYTWYSETLVSLCLQLWHQRDILDPQLKKLFLRLPKLQTFEFIGEIRELKTLCAMCCQIRARKCNVNSINIQLQDVIHGEMNREKFRMGIQCLLICFKKDFDKMNVSFHINFYAS